ncbi:hypothetical protein ASD55_05175 [Rhodanobacter sp. Root561]|nr:hypothetical protein ASD55_05175 [Rhodanobacter sp. Root561]
MTIVHPFQVSLPDMTMSDGKPLMIKLIFIRFRRQPGKILRVVSIAMACLWLFLASPVPAATPHAVDAPAVRVQAFYQWYLGELSRDQNPLDEDNTMDRYVSKALVSEIRKQANSPDGLEQDYFIEAQDILEDWPNHVAVTDEKVDGKTATVRVVLGTIGATGHELKISLVKLGNCWKIRTVTPAE